MPEATDVALHNACRAAIGWWPGCSAP